MNLDPLQRRICQQQQRLFTLANESGCSIKEFATDFLNSDYCRRFIDARYSWYQFAYIKSWFAFLEQEGCVRKPRKKDERALPDDVAGWIGFMYRHIHFAGGLESREIIKAIPFDVMLHHYPGYHALDRRCAVQSIMEKFNLIRHVDC